MDENAFTVTSLTFLAEGTLEAELESEFGFEFEVEVDKGGIVNECVHSQ
jgi:hypothetical protein